MIRGNTADSMWSTILGTLNAFAGRGLHVNDEVYKAATLANAGLNPVTGRSPSSADST